MRKNSIRKFIHAVLDVLPLLVIPIFALNILHKETEPIIITVNESYYETQVLFETNEVSTFNDLQTNKIYHCNEFPITYLDDFTDVDDTFYFNIYFIDEYDIGYSDFYVDEFYYQPYNSNLDNYWTIGFNNSEAYGYFTNDALYDSVAFIDYDITLSNFDFVFKTDYNLELFKTYCQNNSISASIFGSSDFKVYQTIYHENEPVVYDNTDIGSQFVYALYTTVDNYFNMNQVFNLSTVYSWFEMNIFGGSAPLSIYIVWNIMIYELVMDLLMLLYALFMFFIDFTQKLLEKPFNAIK